MRERKNTTYAELSELVGIRVLDGRAQWVTKLEDHDSDSAFNVAYRLDGQWYAFTEDPSDGYRSSLGYAWKPTDAEVDEHQPARFAPRVVTIRLACGSDDYNDHHLTCEDPHHATILVATNEGSNETIFSVGTNNFDDWYPSFVCTWNPPVDNVTKEG